MTAGPTEDSTAASAQSQGEAASARHLADALAQHQASGSTVVVEPAVTADSHAVSWTNADTTAQPTLVPSEPRPVGQQRQHDGPPAA
jgi:hypothetical protein